MDTFNEQQLSMCETNELVDYIAELRVEIDELEKEKEELYDEDGIECSLTYRELDEEHDELKEKWLKLKNPVIYDRDMRCSQLDMRIGYSFLHDFLEPYVDGIEEKIIKDKEEYVWSEVSKCISNAIEDYIRVSDGGINSHILGEVGECYHKLDTQGCFKEAEDE